MNSRKGQVTIFIILGILIVAGVVFVIVINGGTDFFKNIFSKEASYPPKVQNVKDAVQNCIDESLKRVIEINSLQGGYYFAPSNSAYYDSNEVDGENVDYDLIRNIPFYYDRKLIVPSLQDLKDEISYGLASEFSSCFDSESYVDGAVDFEGVSVDPDFSRFDSEVVIKEGIVSVNVVFPVKISTGEGEGSVYELRDFDSYYDTNFYLEYALASKISSVQNIEDNVIDLTTNSKLATDYNAQLLNEEYYEDDDSFVILYNILMEEPKNTSVEVFSFAHRLRRYG